MGKVFLNDRLVDVDKAGISVSDAGFLYGAGLFETMRSCKGVVFALDDHLDRLFFSAKVLSIEHNYSKEFITEAVDKVLKANELSDARLRLTLTAGAMSESDGQRKATLLITAAKFQAYPSEYYKKGVLVVICPFKQNPSEPIYGHKTVNYYSRMIGLKQAHEKKASEAIWFTVDNRLAEGCISNIFLVKDSILYTPPIKTPVLAGVARKSVCEIAVRNSIELVEKDLFIDDVLAADEIFLTNVIMQVLPVTGVEKHTVGDGKPGPISQKMHKLFSEFVKDKCQTGKE